MRVYTFFIIFLALSLTVYSQSWVIIGNVNNPGPSPSICVSSDMNVWIAGGNGDTSKVFRSVNGGLNWTIVPSTGINKQLTCVWGFNSNTVYVGEGVVTGYARLMKTTNAGLNWSIAIQTDVNGGHFTGLAFTKTNNVYGYAMATRIFRSSNNGVNWFEVNAGTGGVSNANNSLMIIDNNFYGFGLDQGAPRVRLTTNNGNAWNTYSVNIEGNYTSGIAFHTNKLYGLVSTSSSMPLVARTTDGGISWIPVDVGPGLSGTTYLNWVPYSSVVYILGQNGKIKRSINNGLTWTNMTVPPATNVTHFDFINLYSVLYGYAVSSTGAVLKVIDSILIITGMNNKNNIPADYSLSQNYPNPFNPVTVIDFSLPYDTDVRLTVFDVLGREVSTLVNERLPAGRHNAQFDASGQPSGAYYYKITTKDFTDTKRMILIK